MPNFTDELDVYIGVQKDVMNATDFDRYTMGDHSPRSPFNLNTSANILPVDLLPGQTVVIYLRARNQDASLNVSVDVFSPTITNTDRSSRILCEECGLEA